MCDSDGLTADSAESLVQRCWSSDAVGELRRADEDVVVLFNFQSRLESQSFFLDTFMESREDGSNF